MTETWLDIVGNDNMIGFPDASLIRRLHNARLGEDDQRLIGGGLV